MTQTAQTDSESSPPPADQEMEDLLQQAESLSREVVADDANGATATETVEPPETSEAPEAPGLETPEAIKATETPETPETPATPEHETPEPGSAASSADGAKNPADTPPVEPKSVSDDSAGVAEPRVEHQPTPPVPTAAKPEGTEALGHRLAPLIAADEQPDARRQSDPAAAAGPEPDPAPSVEKPATAERASVIRRAKLILSRASTQAWPFSRRAAVGLVTAPPRVVAGLLVWADRPFAKLSTGSKKRIGIVAIVTLVMGVLSVVLPMLVNGNPYTDMKRYLD